MLDDDPAVEARGPDQTVALSRKPAEAFGEEAWLAPIKKRLLT